MFVRVKHEVAEETDSQRILHPLPSFLTYLSVESRKWTATTRRSVSRPLKIKKMNNSYIRIFILDLYIL